ncbi:ATP-binding protein [Flavihumibacter rivuli]|uniref:sensor histidine kinase n=1 Tax=Flavihumibacter rivuli TaxID=2838156 RepID=UPI001BDE249F|nr:ATP-binding protein [Flavihumibacter rivuli]ULQ56461.1 ATP-binding protein [Flavihumibacter rivuli]
MALRLKGLQQEYLGNYENAISFYFATLSASREGGYQEYEMSALSDLAIAYTEIKQYSRARDFYLDCLKISERNGEVSNLISGYSNIGAIYNLLNMPDSALYYLRRAAELAQQFNHHDSDPFINNNLGNVYFKKKDFAKSLEYFRNNLVLHLQDGNESNLWTDYLNLSDAFIELKQFDSARHYADLALSNARSLHSRQKEADTYSIFAKLYERLGQYRKAYEFQQQWYQLDTALVNESTNNTIAQMQERLHARDREQQNKLLLAAVEQEKLRNKVITFVAIGAGAVLVLVAFFLVWYRRANKKLKEVNTVIVKQKEKLVTLNHEKNALISIVSHDLSTPFASIAMWSQLLTEEADLNPEQRNALQKIRVSALNGEKLIRNILEVEKGGTSGKNLELEETDLRAYLGYLAEFHFPAAGQKNITVRVEGPEEFFLLTDQDLLKRIVDNLLSNAIKYSPSGKRVVLSYGETEADTWISVQDEGLGIPVDEQELLFKKYAQLSSRPTAGESSTGLGLSIVKRLVNELNGTIHFTSAPGEGSVFTVRFPK